MCLKNQSERWPFLLKPQSRNGHRFDSFFHERPRGGDIYNRNQKKKGENIIEKMWRDEFLLEER